MTNNNADDYAKARLNKFFIGYPGSLTGQCVSLVKWFLQDMTKVPNPQSARGHAKDFGDALVAQGYATKPATRRRGDIVVWKQDGSGYGHIGVLLSGDRVFEENVGLVGTPSKQIPDGQGGYTTVYASRIDPLYVDWRTGAPTFYRIKSYVEKKEEKMVTLKIADVLYRFRLGTTTSDWGKANAVGKMTADQLDTHLINSEQYKALQAKAQAGTVNLLDRNPSIIRDNYKTPSTNYVEVTETLYRKV